MERTGPGSPRPATLPLAALAAAFSIGILAGPVLSANSTILILCSAFAGVVALTVNRGLTKATIIAAGFVLAGAAMQSSRAVVPPDAVGALLGTERVSEEEPVELEGDVAYGPELIPGGVLIDVECRGLAVHGSRIPASGIVRVYVATLDPESVSDLERLNITPGKPVSVSLRLRRQDGFRNPGGIRYSEVLARRGLEATAAIKSPLLIDVRGPASGRLAERAVNLVRATLIGSVLKTLDQPAAGIVAASMLGNRYFLSRETADAYRAGGTFHVLVISGLHVSFVGALAIWLLSLLPIGRAYRFVGAAAAVWAFAGLSGFGTPVTRAALMFSAVAVANCSHRRSIGLNALGGCVLAMLADDPSALFDPSFQLTTVSAGAIVGAAFPVIEKIRAVGGWYPSPKHPFPPDVPGWLKTPCELLYWSGDSWVVRIKGLVWECGIFKAPLSEKRKRGVPRKLAAALFEGLIVSAVIQIFLLPLLVLNFHRVTPASPLINLVAGGFLLVQNLFALLSVAFGSFSVVAAGPFAALSETAVHLSVLLQSAISGLPGGTFRVPAYAGQASVIYPIYFVPVILLSAAGRSWDPFATESREKRFARALRVTAACASGSILFLGSLILAHPFSKPLPDGRLRVEFLDVGQGDSIFVTFPNGETMLVDGGGRRRIAAMEGTSTDPDESFEPDRRSIGESVVSEFLWEKGYSRIDRVVVTHSDSDHLEGLIDVARNFSIGSAYFGKGQGSGGAFPELRGVLAAKQVPFLPVAAGDSFEAGGALVRILNPIGRPGGDAGSENNNSVVLNIGFGARTILLTGDIERIAEAGLMRWSSYLRADVVKVPHHGSRTSSTKDFVVATSPEIAVISVGRHSPFGHPHKDVVERWRKYGSEVLTTGESGTVTIVTDGSALEIRRYADETGGN